MYVHPELSRPHDAARHVACFALAAMLICGCGSSDDAAPASSSESTSESTATAASSAGQTAPETAEEPTAESDDESGDASGEDPTAGPLEPMEVQAIPSDGDGTDLLHTVQSTLTADSVYRNDVSQIDRLVDGDLETAWNSATLAAGDERPRTLTIELPEDVRVSAIDITAGYTKTSGSRDLFTANLRVTKVRIRHGSTLVEATLDPEHRGLQRIPVQGDGGTWTIDIAEWTPGTRPDWRELCVSELRVVGEPGAAAPPATSPRTVLAAGTQADAIASGDVVPGAVEPPPLGDIELPSRPDAISLSEIVLTPEMMGTEPTERTRHYNKIDHDQVYCYFVVSNPTEEATTLTLAWEDANGHSRSAPTSIDVPGRRRFLHYRYTSTSWRRPGTYSCVIRDADDVVIGRIPFALAEEPEGEGDY